MLLQGGVPEVLTDPWAKKSAAPICMGTAHSSSINQ